MSGFGFGKAIKEFTKAVWAFVLQVAELIQTDSKRRRFVHEMNASLLVGATSAMLLAVILFAGAYGEPSAVGEGLIYIVRTLCTWTLLAAGATWLAVRMNGSGTFSQTAAVFYKIMPIAYVAAAAGAMIADILLRPFAGEETRFIVQTAAAFLAQFAIVAWLLPSRLAAVHQLSRKGEVVMVAIPVFVLAANIMFAALPTYSESKGEFKTEPKVQSLMLEQPVSWQEARRRIPWPVFNRVEIV